MLTKTWLIAAGIATGILVSYSPGSVFANSAESCPVSIEGSELAIDEQCIRRTPGLRTALVDMAIYLRTVPDSRLVSPEYQGPLDKERLQRTVEQLIRWVDHAPGSDVPLGKQFDFYSLGEPQSKRPVQYSGFFTPILEGSPVRTDTYQYPIYAKPKDKGPLPSRREISQGALAGKGLEIAWTNNPVDYHFMQVQGSGLVRYPDGNSRLLGFAGKNSYPYTSIGRYMQEKGYLRTDNVSNTAVHEWLKHNPDKLDEVLNANQSFVFFRLMDDSGLRGAAGLPVVPGHTASVDTTMIPFGSVLLAELPMRDSTGKIVQHEWRLLMATDRRSTDRGAVSIGIYTGAGEQAQLEAQRLFPAGRAFILQSSGS